MVVISSRCTPVRYMAILMTVDITHCTQQHQSHMVLCNSCCFTRMLLVASSYWQYSLVHLHLPHLSNTANTESPHTIHHHDAHSAIWQGLHWHHVSASIIWKEMYHPEMLFAFNLTIILCTCERKLHCTWWLDVSRPYLQIGHTLWDCHRQWKAFCQSTII